MSLNKVVSLEEHCCLADFGICFSTLTFGICTSAGDGKAGDAGGGEAGDVGGVAGDGGVDDGEAESGNAGNGAGGLRAYQTLGI